MPSGYGRLGAEAITAEAKRPVDCQTMIRQRLCPQFAKWALDGVAVYRHDLQCDETVECRFDVGRRIGSAGNRLG